MAMKTSILTPFCLGVGYVIHVVYIHGQLYQWLLVLSDYVKAS